MWQQIKKKTKFVKPNPNVGNVCICGIQTEYKLKKVFTLTCFPIKTIGTTNV